MMRQECREQSYREAFTKERGNRRHDRHSLGATQWEKKAPASQPPSSPGQLPDPRTNTHAGVSASGQRPSLKSTHSICAYATQR